MATKKKTVKYANRMAKKTSSVKAKTVSKKTVKKKVVVRPVKKSVIKKKSAFKRGITAEELAKYWKKTGHLTKKEAMELEASIADFRRGV